MNKIELVAAIAEKTQLTKKDSESALRAFVEVVSDQLQNGDKGQIAGRGTLEKRMD